MKASEKYKRGQYNTCNFEVFSDGIQIISIYDPKSEGRKHLTFKVKNLNKENEKILKDEDDIEV
ncbi:unnamed protein product [marine sediment metagenome]|uniref:Uncharacterized protein n=1 Tax=marine sediment metagenome TaxID=412755 RepID=X1T484_9ZZZZ